MIIDLIVGCRPNFVKAAAILHAASKYPNVRINIVHTGQHTDLMSDPFFKELGLPYPEPHANLRVWGNPRPTERTGSVISMLATTFLVDKPDYVMVVGDTDSTLAGAITAKKMGIPLIHVEAGLRCGNMAMQEELNRVLVDSVSDICYTTSEAARDNLIAEGSRARIQFVGNVMVDTLYRFLPEAFDKYPCLAQPYAVLTLHRAESVDKDDVIFPILDAIREVANEIPVIWPVHPRLKSRLGLWKDNGMFAFVEPMGYLQFIAMLSEAKFVMTDSGGVQEETTALGTPCLTLRDSTERPETRSIDSGSNYVVGRKPDVILAAASAMASQRVRERYNIPDLWDGHAADRIMSDLAGGVPN